MAELIDAVEACVSTDFAILRVAQGHPDADPGPYATSEPGGIALQAGTKYAEMDVRVERWDARPPAAADEWEDQDVLPWRPLAGQSYVEIGGFDPAEEVIDVSGLGAARVEVLAWGRNRYDYSSGPAGEDWREVQRERSNGSPLRGC